MFYQNYLQRSSGSKYLRTKDKMLLLCSWLTISTCSSPIFFPMSLSGSSGEHLLRTSLNCASRLKRLEIEVTVGSFETEESLSSLSEIFISKFSLRTKLLLFFGEVSLVCSWFSKEASSREQNPELWLSLVSYASNEAPKFLLGFSFLDDTGLSVRKQLRPYRWGVFLFVFGVKAVKVTVGWPASKGLVTEMSLSDTPSPLSLYVEEAMLRLKPGNCFSLLKTGSKGVLVLNVRNLFASWGKGIFSIVLCRKSEFIFFWK